MRLLLKTVDGMLRGLGEPEIDRHVMAMIAREAGMGMASDVEPTTMAKLPLPSKQLGMSIHNDMDGRMRSPREQPRRRSHGASRT